MSSDLFDQLAETHVPPPPAQFEQRVHRQLNESLLAGQLIELAVRAIPHAMRHLAKAVAALVVYTATGSYPVSHEKETK